MQETQTEVSLRRAARLIGIARGLGAVVDGDAVPDVRVGPRMYRSFSVKVADNLAALRLLNVFAGDDAANGIEVRALAASYFDAAKVDAAAAGLGDWRPWYARKVHAFVRDAIEYVDDPRQVFRSSDVTLNLGAGNCVNTARLIVALCRTVGLEAEAVPVPDAHGEITHTCARIKVAGVWTWAEATVAARWGEAPHVAARRLGIERADVARA
jgi:transglutaminase-like putative cysteine protease